MYIACLHGHGNQDESTHYRLKQDADDTCLIFDTERLSCTPAIQLECDHIFSLYQCFHNALSKK